VAKRESADEEKPRPYVSTIQLAHLTPWTVDAIDKLVARGQLVQGVHWFQPAGPRSTRIFRWESICAYIEGRDTRDAKAAEPGEGAAHVIEAVSRLLADN
jgi:hypothetical protein